MNHTRLVLLNLRDAAGYQRYREEMAPVLARFGGAFLLDVQVSEAYISPVDFEVGRVLLIQFPNDEASANFFADEDYRKVRARWFDSSVQHTNARVLPTELDGQPIVGHRRAPGRVLGPSRADLSTRDSLASIVDCSAITPFCVR